MLVLPLLLSQRRDEKGRRGDAFLGRPRVHLEGLYGGGRLQINCRLIQIAVVEIGCHWAVSVLNNGMLLLLRIVCGWDLKWLDSLGGLLALLLIYLIVLTRHIIRHLANHEGLHHLSLEGDLPFRLLMVVLIAVIFFVLDLIVTNILVRLNPLVNVILIGAVALAIWWRLVVWILYRFAAIVGGVWQTDLVYEVVVLRSCIFHLISKREAIVVSWLSPIWLLILHHPIIFVVIGLGCLYLDSTKSKLDLAWLSGYVVPVVLPPFFAELRRGWSNLPDFHLILKFVFDGTLGLLGGNGRVGRVKHCEAPIDRRGHLRMLMLRRLLILLTVFCSGGWLWECGLETVRLECVELVAETLPLLRRRAIDDILATVFAQIHGFRLLRTVIHR